MSAVPQGQPDRAPQSPSIKLYDDARPSHVGAFLSPQMRLSEFYRAFFRPVCLVARGAAPRNLDQYDQSIAYWVTFTEDPPLDEITDYTTAQFVTELAQLPGGPSAKSLTRPRRDAPPISPNTIRKHCTHVQAVLDRTGPRGREARFRKAQGLLQITPYIEKPAARKKDAEDNFAVDEISALLRHCNAATAPEYLTVRDRIAFWQNLFLCDYNTGLRVGSLTIFEWSKIKQDTKGHWWIHVRVKGGNHRKVHCNEFALAAIERMRPITGTYPQVFYFPHSVSWLQEQRRRILAAANIPPDRRFGFHGLRKAMVTEASAFDVLAASLQAGHQSVTTTQNSYVNPGRVATGMAKLPQPDAPSKGARQMDLF